MLVIALLSWVSLPVLAIAGVSINVTETTFSPNGDGFRDTSEIHWNQSEAGNVIVRVLQNGNEVSRLGTWNNLAAGSHAFIWAGTTRYDGGSILADGRYTVQVLVTNAGGTGNAATDLLVASSLIGPGLIENWSITSDKIAPGAIKGYHLFQDGQHQLQLPCLFVLSLVLILVYTTHQLFFLLLQCARQAHDRPKALIFQTYAVSLD